MEKIRVIYEAAGHTLTVWLDDPAKEHACEETAEERVVMKAAAGRAIGFGRLRYPPAKAPEQGLAVETVIRSEA